MTINISTFDFDPGASLRSVSQDGQPWFVVKDVCAALGLQNPTMAMADIDPADRTKLNLAQRGLGAVHGVNESGLYSLILRSRKPGAKDFQRWVTRHVLPTLRKDGVYVLNQEKPITDDLTLPDLLAQIADIQAKVDALKAAKVMAWSKHQEEKRDRYHALRFMRSGGRSGRGAKA